MLVPFFRIVYPSSHVNASFGQAMQLNRKIFSFIFEFFFETYSPRSTGKKKNFKYEKKDFRRSPLLIQNSRLVLGIETTCDETACSIVKDGRVILSNVIYSQIPIHEKFGGVVPELACRKHVDALIPVIDQALNEAKCKLSDIDLFAVAYGPGLIGALLIGLNAAKTLSVALDKPFVGVNHVEAHLYAALMDNPETEFPCLGVVLSGGHTSLVYMKGIGQYELIGQTVDDAIGEAFDKTAKIMGLPYPGGPHIEALAAAGNPLSVPLKAGTVKGKPYDFSFSGLKTGVLYAYKSISDKSKEACKNNLNDLSEREAADGVVCDEVIVNTTVEEQNASDAPHSRSNRLSDSCTRPNLAASFQHAAFKDVIKKTLLAAQAKGCKTLVFGGGVTNNQTLRKLFAEQAKDYKQLWPSLGLSLDNAAMIAGLGYHKFLERGGDPLDLEAVTLIAF
jgi:N6-L-threonylcarbamoyladenine synthase